MESWKDIETLADIPRFHAHHRPQRTALIFGERRTTFGELDRSACEAAAGLWAEGARPGARIAWLDLNSDRTYEMLFGCAKARMVFCPVNWRLALPEIRQTIEDAGAELLFVGKRFFDLAERLDLPNVRKIFTIDADRAAGRLIWNGVRALAVGKRRMKHYPTILLSRFTQAEQPDSQKG
jgi:long-chain acyl-CoA synthetase